MAAYLISEYLEILDQAAMAEYRRQVTATIEAFGGRSIARGGQTMPGQTVSGQIVPLEGDWDPMRLTIIEFPSLDHAQQWYASDAYRSLKALRQGASRIRMLFIEGI
jgi:uncharacterized protein (DUF1330 family)